MTLLAMVSVFQGSDATLADRLVLLALADHAHDDGSNAFPAIKTIAAKARVHERTVKRSLQSLRDNCEIIETGKTRHGVTIWHLTVVSPLSMPTGLDAASQADRSLRGGDNLSPEGFPSMTVKTSGGDLSPDYDGQDATPPVADRHPQRGMRFDVARWIGANAHRVQLEDAIDILDGNFGLEGAELDEAVATLKERRQAA